MARFGFEGVCAFGCLEGASQFRAIAVGLHRGNCAHLEFANVATPVRDRDGPARDRRGDRQYGRRCSRKMRIH